MNMNILLLLLFLRKNEENRNFKWQNMSRKCEKKNSFTFSHPSGGKRAKNRFIRGEASDETLSSGDVLWLSSKRVQCNK